MKKFIFVAVGVAAFIFGYGALADAYPSPAPYGRASWRGYFTNSLDTAGTYVLPNSYSGNAFPASVNSASSFISFIESQLSSNSQKVTGASFIIQTMIGSSRNRPPSGGEIAAFEDKVNEYQNNGRVNFFANFCYNLNTYYQGPIGGGSVNDDAFFDDSGCATAIVFYNPDGSTYAIRRQCANPVGYPQPLQNLSNWSMGASSSVDNASPKPNQTINFSHSVVNNGPTSTGGQDIWFDILNQAGASQQGGQNSGAYNAGQSKPVHTPFPVTIPPGTAPGTQYCQRVLYDWANSAGARNGLGNLACATVVPDYNLVPTITLSQGGAPLTSGSYVQPGTSVTFTYSVNNSGYGNATGIACNMYANNRSGYVAIPSPADSTGPAPVGPTCTNTFPFRTTTPLGAETVNNAPDDTTLCRSLWVNPATPGGAPASIESCVYVASEPYARVYGGDVSAGNGQPSNCGLTTNAAIVGWNKESGGGYGGAGVQFAALALHNIYDFATNLGNTAGTATAPSGLAFANTTTSGSAVFGGRLGSMSTSCIPNYYGTPTGGSPGNNINAGGLANGTYTATGPLTINTSTFNAGKKVSIYVNGDAIIAGDITFNGNWDAASIPLFQLIVTGNIYIASGVGTISGMFVAQSATNGIIYTCSTGSTAVAPSSAGYYNTCKNRLTINGSFVARQVQLLRTNGTFNNANATDLTTNTNPAETFNYGPAFWIPQPVGTPTSGDYDSVTSLPPIL